MVEAEDSPGGKVNVKDTRTSLCCHQRRRPATSARGVVEAAVAMETSSVVKCSGGVCRVTSATLGDRRSPLLFGRSSPHRTALLLLLLLLPLLRWKPLDRLVRLHDKMAAGWSRPLAVNRPVD